MEEIKKNNAIYYQEKLHHREQLRQNIKPQTIDMLEINHNPSAISRKAAQSLYQNQLEREFIAKSYLRNERDGDLSLSRNKSSVFVNNASKMIQRQSPVQFKDYYIEKDNKIKEHIMKNEDGGNGFFKASQEHENMRKRQLKQMGETLKAQINLKKRIQWDQKAKKYRQQQIRMQILHQNRVMAKQQKSYSNKLKQNFRNQYLKQIDEAKSRNASCSKFHYNNQTRHNPITNPIEYHIENPYILKQIQENKQNLRLRL